VRHKARYRSRGDGFEFEVPLHLTGFFYPVYRESWELTGSLGAGLVIRPGLKCVVSEGEGVWFNSEPISWGPALEIYNEMGGGSSVHLSGNCLPGAGYAFSAASGLAVAACYALAGKMSAGEAAMKAHVSEVRCKTGLGDVLAIWDGVGLVLRKRPGGPGVGEVENIRISDKIAIVTSELGRLSTESLLTTHHEKIMEAGERSYREFLKNPSLANFLEISNRFSKELGLVDRSVEEIVRPVSPRLLGWYVKKRVLVMVVEEAEIEEVAVNIGASLPIVRVFKPGEVEWRRYLETILDTSPS
jgi:pantoate kinase